MKTLKTLSGHYILRGIEIVPIKNVPGFPKKYRGPIEPSYERAQFASELSTAEWESNIETITEAIVKHYKYQAKDIILTSVGDSQLITMPGFDIAFCRKPDKNNPNYWQIITEVRAISRQSIVKEKKFGNVFFHQCRTIVVNHNPTSIKSVLSQIEAISELNKYCFYNEANHTITLKLNDDRIQVVVNEDEINISRLNPTKSKLKDDFNELFADAQSALDGLRKLGVVFQLAEKDDSMTKEACLDAILGRKSKTAQVEVAQLQKRTMSPEARARIGAAQKARWAKLKAVKQG